MSQSIELMDFFEIKEQGFRNESEQEFLTALFAYADEWAQLGVTNDYCYINYWDSTLMVAFDVCDWNGQVVLRSLKVDFNSTNILMGETDSNLFDSKFEANSPVVNIYSEVGATPTDFANTAAKWLFQELSRQIVLKEWITGSYHYKQYEMPDRKESLSWSDSQNKKRSNLGSPTRVSIVHPLKDRTTL